MVDVFHELTWLLCNICVCQVSIVSTRFLPKTGVLVQLLQMHDSISRLTIKLDRLMIVSNQAFSPGFCMYH